MTIVLIFTTFFFLAAVWFGVRAHDLRNAVVAADLRNKSLHQEILQTRAERQVAISKHQRVMNDLRNDPSNPYYIPPVTPQVARRKQNRGNSGSSRQLTNNSSSNSGSSRSDDGSTAAIIATTAAVATYSGYDSGSSYCDSSSSSSSFDSGCSF